MRARADALNLSYTYIGHKNARLIIQSLDSASSAGRNKTANNNNNNGY